MTSHGTKIRVENQPGVAVSSYAALGRPDAVVRPFSILFIKPFQRVGKELVYGPPLGILTLVAGLRRFFGDAITIHFWDMMVYNDPPALLASRLDELQPDVVAVSALTCEAEASAEIARIVKAWHPGAITVLGGAITLRQAPRLLEESRFDWLFEGAADRTFIQALQRQFSGQPLGDDIPGFSYRVDSGAVVLNTRQDLITDLDALPMPAWDLVDFDRYRRRDRPYMSTNIHERPWAYLFTSRGCPYLCTYCHDIFTKRFVYMSEENVLEQIRVLHEEYGISDFHVIDDIFNLHKPRAQSIMRAIGRRWGGKIRIAFVNGLRGDILDKETIEAMVEGGAYHATIAIETVTPRLQDLAEKYLDVDKALWAAREFSKHGVVVHGNFMLGFPTETPEEIEATLECAINSPFTQAWMTAVLPQPGTPIHDLAMKVSPEACATCSDPERDASPYLGVQSWYSVAYGYDLHNRIRNAYLRFYLNPRRMWRLWRLYPKFHLVRAFFLLMMNTVASKVPATAALLNRLRYGPPREETVDRVITTRGANPRPRPRT